MNEHELLQKLVSFPSITPHDAGCQEWMRQYLSDLGFTCIAFDNPPVANFYAFMGTSAPLVVFAGHTDVVPVGDTASWQSPPFELTAHGDKLIGRGCADMKGSIASFLSLAQRFAKNPLKQGSLGFLITSGEEGDDFEKGTPHVMDALKARGIKPDYCIVGEPSCHQTLGDTIKIGRRGSLTAKLTLLGKQGHVAYPHLAINPIHQISDVLYKLCQTTWDEGNEFFPPTTFQVTHIHSGGHATNIIPGLLNLDFAFRFSTELKPDMIISKVEQYFNEANLTPSITWRVNGLPFLTAKGLLVESAIHAIQTCTGITPTLSTTGGTSDARFIAPHGIEVIEFGLINESIHQVNEWTTEGDLIKLTEIYYQLVQEVIDRHAN